MLLQVLPKLKSLGFNPTIKRKWIRIHLGTRTIYQKERLNHLLPEKLKNNGLNPNEKIVTINQKVYIVRIQRYCHRKQSTANQKKI